MVAPVLPRPQAEVVDGSGYARTEWYDFWRLLSQLVDAGIVTQAQFDDLVARVVALEEGGGLDFVINGPLSIQVDGSPESGAVTLRLRGDTNTPGDTYVYGTGPTGAKGWHALADGFLEGDNISLVVGVDGRTTISTTGGGGVLPVVTGEILSAQPVFVYLPDGSLVYGPVT